MPVYVRASCLVIAAVLIAGRLDRPQAQTPAQLPSKLWVDATAQLLGDTAGWTNKAEIADLDGDGRMDLLFANGGNYSDPGTPEMNGAFLNRGAGRQFEDRSQAIFGTPDITRVIKVADVNADGRADIIVGTTYQRQSRLYLGTGGGAFREATATNLPQTPLSVGDLEVGDVDADGDLDMVLADWGPGNNMSNEGGRTRLWLNDGKGMFTDATAAQMPAALVRFSWDLELADVDNDYDLDVLVSCKRCAGGFLFRNDGKGKFTDDPRGLPQYTNNYEYEPMDLDGDGFLDLVTMNDGEILREQSANRREHVFHNDAKGRFRDATAQWWPADQNIGEDDNMVAFLDFDSDGDADFVIGSLSGKDRLMINDGKGHLTVATDVFVGPDTPGTLGIALGDLDGDGRVDVVQAQGEHQTAVQEKVSLGTGLKPDTAPPSISLVSAALIDNRVVVRARIHDRKSPIKAGELKDVVVTWSTPKGAETTKLNWYGEYLWTVNMPSVFAETTAFRVCATDAAGNRTCVPGPTR